MGQITIETTGSFPLTDIHFETAKAGGHAAALGRSIKYLASMMPDAIALDHKVQEQGEHPPDAAFGQSTADNLMYAPVCEHGKGLKDYCEPCGRTHGGPG